jgi:H3 lysine-79-specific histone-lysine N-methyltransferase
MEKEFKFWWSFFGKAYSNFKLYEGDFFSDEEYIEIDDNNSETATSLKYRKISMNDYVKEIINQSQFIFVNNYAFGASVDHQLKMRFLDMLEGAFIVSSKPFCPLNFRLNDRNLNDFGAILNISEFEPISGTVSWTPNPVSYYIQKIDRTLLEKYFFDMRKASSSSSRSQKSPSPNHHQNGSGSSSSSSPVDKKPPSKVKKRNRSNSGGAAYVEVKKLKEVKSKNSKKKQHRSESLDQEVKRTLNAMHEHVVKSTTSTNTTNDINNTHSSCFNQNSLTKLTDEHLDKKSLKETCPATLTNSNSKISSNNKSNNSSCRLSSKFEFDEGVARQELGDDVIHSIDSYLSKFYL